MSYIPNGPQKSKDGQIFSKPDINNENSSEGILTLGRDISTNTIKAFGIKEDRMLTRDDKTIELLSKVLDELKKLNIHLSILTEEEDVLI